VLFDKIGTLTVGGARLLLIEMARGRKADDVLLLGASLEQASHHTLAEAVVKAAIDRALRRRSPDKSGNHGVGLARDDRRQVRESRLPGNDPPAQTHAARPGRCAPGGVPHGDPQCDGIKDAPALVRIHTAQEDDNLRRTHGGVAVK
jgi:hypothetical protein